MDERKRYTAEKKVEILREVMEEGKSVSVTAEKYEIHPNNIFNWRKQLFEGAVKTFGIKRPEISEKAEARHTAALEEKLKEKDAVIAELASELLILKKKSSGLMPGGRR
jgi:transposase-like protein